MMTRLIIIAALYLAANPVLYADTLPTIPENYKTFHFASETNLSVKTKASIGAAAKVMAKNVTTPDPKEEGWIYEVTTSGQGDKQEFHVFCLRYRTINKVMTFMPGGHCTVIMDGKFRVTRIMPGE